MGLFSKWREKREKWHIIDNMHDLPIGKYLEIQEIGKRQDEAIDKSTAVLSVLTGWSVADIENLSLPEYSALASGCGWLYEEMPIAAVRGEYRIGDYRLRAVDAESLTYAQFVEFQQFCKDVESNILNLLSVVLVPLGKRYGEGYNVRDVRKWIARCLPTDEAFTLVAFFLSNAEASLPRLASSLESIVRQAPARTTEQMRKKAEALAMLKAISASGDGSPTNK